MHMRVKLPKWPKCACPVMLNMYTSVNINNDLRVNQMKHKHFTDVSCS